MSDARGANDEVTAELTGLARVLQAEPAEVAFLADRPGEELRRLRRQVSDELFAQDREQFHRLAALAAAVPAPVAATITQHAIPPLLAALTAQVLNPDKAAAMVARLPVSYLCDVSIAMDPDRAADIIAGIPADRVAAVAGELARRGEWVTIGGFVAHVNRAGLTTSVAAFNGRELLHVSFYLDDRARVDEITDLLTDAQLDDMIAAAARDDLWPLLADVVANTSDVHNPRLRSRFAAAPAEVRAAAPAEIQAWAVA